MRHPDLDLLLRHAGGNVDGTEDLLIAAHLDLCSACAGTVAGFEAAFGEAFEALPPSPLTPESIRRAIGVLDTIPQIRPQLDAPVASAMPASLRRRIGTDLSAITWHPLSPTAWLSEWRISQGAALARLLKIDAGGRVPGHRHKGFETLLVLEGSYADDQGRHQRGDVVRFEPETHHLATAPEGPCICLVVFSDAIEFTEPLWPETSVGG